jgi:N-acetyl-gamma-glutamyl-phosphate reductase
MSFSVSVAGASGYAGGELLRILVDHPQYEVRTVTAHSNVGKSLIEVQPHLRSLAHLTLEATTPEVLSGSDIVFLALPHGASGAITEQLDPSVLVVDCGADHRLERKSDWAAFYSGDYHEAWAYGVPELPVGNGKQREFLAQARRIAAPGCNASSVSLALAPGINAGLIDSHDIVAVLAVGSSGAGKSLHPHLLASEVLGTANPYGVGGTHRHIPETLQALRRAGAGHPAISFTPVLVPMSRGILAITSAPVNPGVTDAHIRLAWENAYAHEPFVHLLPAGLFPRTADVLGSNTALMGVAIDEAAGRLVSITAIDNLVKGTAGAAIQSANIALGLDETTGLNINGVAP